MVTNMFVKNVHYHIDRMGILGSNIKNNHLIALGILNKYYLYAKRHELDSIGIIVEKVEELKKNCDLICD